MRAIIVPGFLKIMRWARALADATSLEFDDPEPAESWIVVNTSGGGYGAIVPQVKGDWVQVGALLGLRPETSTVCCMAVVRRVSRDSYGQHRVGIQVLDRIAVPVTLSPATGGRSGPAAPVVAALLLSNRPDDNGEVTLLMRAGSFARKRNLRMRVRNNGYLLAPSRLLEGGEDFDWARFKVLRQI